MENYENNNTNPNFSTNQEKINLNFDILNDFPNQEVFEAKLGNLAFLKKKRFSENLTEKDEKIKITLEKGGTEDKEIPAINFIRWRYKKANKTVIDDNNENLPENSANTEDLDNYLNLNEKSKNNKMQTNSKIVEWSDGTMQLIIGKEYFDINLSAMDNCHYAMYDKNNDLFVVKNQVKNRIIIVPSDMTTNMDDRFKNQNENTLKTKLAYSYFDKNEYNKEEFGKKYFKKINTDSLKKNNVGKDQKINFMLKKKF